MDKGRMVYVDENGTTLVTRLLHCDMRPVRSGCGLHIVNTFRYGGIGSAAEFTCFVRHFARQYEEERAEKHGGLISEMPGIMDPGSVCLFGDSMKFGQAKTDRSDVDTLSCFLEPESYCYVIHGDRMTVFCGLEPAETVCRRPDASAPLVDECEFVSILETLKSGEGISAPVQDLVIRLLELLMRDWGGEISYYVYDLDFGRSYEPGMFSDRDGYVDLSCDQALYRDLVRTGF